MINQNRYSDVTKLMPVFEKSGAIASFDDGAENVPVESLIVNIEPVQAGSGDPSPSNVRAISGWTSVRVYRSDDQLYLHSNIQIGKNWTKAAAADRAINEFAVEPNTTYRVCRNGDSTMFGQVLFIEMNASSQIKNFGLSYSYDAEITTDSNTNKVIIQYAKTSAIVASDFARETVSVSKVLDVNNITLPNSAGTVYGGELDVSTGVLTVDRVKITYDGSSSQSWTASANVTGYGFYSPVHSLIRLSDYRGSIICDRLETKKAYNEAEYLTAQNVITGYMGDAATYPGQNWIYAKANGLTTAADFKAWLSSNPIDVVYKLATPQTYQLTPAKINTLLGNNSIFADTGNVDVKYHADIPIVINKLISAISE